VCRHTTNYAHSLFNKNINFCAVCSWDLCLQLHFTCSCTAVARAYTQLPHDNRHWTCKRLSPDSVRDSIRIWIAVAYSIRDSIRTEISDSQVPSWLRIFTCTEEVTFSGLLFCLFLNRTTWKLLNRFSQNSTERWRMSHGRNDNFFAVILIWIHKILIEMGIEPNINLTNRN